MQESTANETVTSGEKTPISRELLIGHVVGASLLSEKMKQEKMTQLKALAEESGFEFPTEEELAAFVKKMENRQ